MAERRTVQGQRIAASRLTAASLVSTALIAVVWWAGVGDLPGAEPESEQASKLETASSQPTAAQREWFEKHVRPVLAEHCYECHSGRSKELKAGLRVDSRAALLQGGDSGPAIVPGKPDESLLVQALRYEGFEMPPTRRLDEATVSLVARWIADGALWPDEPPAESAVANAGQESPTGSNLVAQRAAQHWCWRPISRPTPPTVGDAAWAETPVDQFILSQLEQHDLSPVGDASRVALVRRLYFDLIGLPPSPDELARWESHPSPQWYEQLVDELLESQQFGEKWARHWLDLVRYAETCGHEFDYPIYEAYRYRDYVIRALNADVPYDQWVMEQLAGDLLPAPRLHPEQKFNESVIGTGFWFLGESVHAPTDVRADEVTRIDNQLDVFGKTFLGLTIACARCHDHKFDPLTSKDYYALSGLLQSSRRQFAMLDPQGQIARSSEEISARQDELHHTIQAQLDSQLPTVDQFRAGLAESLAAAGREGVELSPVAARWRDALQAATSREPEHPLELAAQWLQGQPWGEVTGEETAGAWCDFGSPAYTDDGWASTGLGFGTGPTQRPQWIWSDGRARLVDGGWAISDRAGTQASGVLRSPEFTLDGEFIHYRLRSRGVQIRLIVDGYFMDEFNALLFADCQLNQVDTQGQVRWVTQHRDLDHYVGHRAHLEILDQRDGYVELDEVRFSKDGRVPQRRHGWSQQLAAALPASGLAAATDGAARAAEAQRLAETLAQCWESTRQRLVAGQPTADDAAAVNWMLEHQLCQLASPEIQSISEPLTRMQASIPQPVKVLAITDGSGVNDHVHIRGSHKNLGAEVPRRLPEVLGGTECGDQRHSGRLELARELVRPDNPLLARVAVNRLWHHLMGRGIVPTVDDFGVMGQPPSHPELLDWLAQDFIDHGWSLKHTIRRIATSHVYRLASGPVSPHVRELDPDNRWWSHAMLRRLPAESIRDAVLAVSGQLKLDQFGPSVPVHLTAFMTGRGRPESGPLDGAGRRSIYLEVRRNFLHPLLQTFDMPIPFSTVGRRSSSNVPAQSLALLNDPFLHEQAAHWARAVLQQEPSGPDAAGHRIRRMYRAAFGRAPTDGELSAVTKFIAQSAQERGLDEQAEIVWQDLAHVLLNSKEFIYLY